MSRFQRNAGHEVKELPAEKATSLIASPMWEDDMTPIRESGDSALTETTEQGKGKGAMPTPNVSKMGYNPANFAYWIGTGPWLDGYSVYYAISFYDSTTQIESDRSEWWGPKTDPKKLYGGFGLIRIPLDPTGQATARRIWRKFEGEPEKMIHEISDNITTKYQDDVL